MIYLFMYYFVLICVLVYFRTVMEKLRIIIISLFMLFIYAFYLLILLSWVYAF